MWFCIVGVYLLFGVVWIFFPGIGVYGHSGGRLRKAFEFFILPSFLLGFVFLFILEKFYKFLDKKYFHANNYYDYVVVSGPIASGKTSFALDLLNEKHKNYIILDSDKLRKKERHTYEGKFYSKEFSLRIRNKMIKEAKKLRRKNKTPILVSTFGTKEKRSFLKKLRSWNFLKFTRILYYDLGKKVTLEESIRRRKRQRNIRGETRDEEIIKKYYNDYSIIQRGELGWMGVEIIKAREYVSGRNRWKPFDLGGFFD